jgi:predicted enzyme related to lactoylglutathione lyase
MHRSQLAGFIIDCRTGDLDAAASFWGAALGLTPRHSAKPEHANYILFERAPDGLDIEVQKVDHQSRVHLDIETDDVEAEIGRLEALGARRVTQVRDWWVLEAPTGHRFCVVPVKRAGFAAGANRWE